MPITLAAAASPAFESHKPVQTARELIASHPATAFFQFAKYRIGEVEAEADISLRADVAIGATGNRGVLNCLIDCLAQLSSPAHLGMTEVAELETSFLGPWRGEPLHGHVRVDLTQGRCAVFTCELSLAESRVCIASAQGTLCSCFGESVE